MIMKTVLIVGSGLSGSVAARIMSEKGWEVEVIENRDHIGGNCFETEENGIVIHKYGPHVFHTNDADVWNFLSRFTEWNEYEHKVFADTDLGQISIPYNATTEQQLGRTLTDEEIQKLIFVKYSEKQWGVSWKDLPKSITGRVPMRRASGDQRYFTDKYQGQPSEGYTTMFGRILSGLNVRTNTLKQEWRDLRHNFDLLIYTGKIDEYFGYKLGHLPYRSLKFEHQLSAVGLSHAAINQCNDQPFTRMYDHSLLNGKKSKADQTIITREYPQAHNSQNEPYYPMPFGEGAQLFKKYKRLAQLERKTVFIGRLATYSYLDMWMAVAQTMVKLRNIS